MLDIQGINHIGIRIGDRDRSVNFYATLGFELETDTGFDQGHPIIMRHPSGVVLNLLGPATAGDGQNVLMDIEDKHPGITHFAMTVASLDDARALMDRSGVAITGSFSFGGMSAIFVRDPDRVLNWSE